MFIGLQHQLYHVANGFLVKMFSLATELMGIRSSIYFPGMFSTVTSSNFIKPVLETLLFLLLSGCNYYVGKEKIRKEIHCACTVQNYSNSVDLCQTKIWVLKCHYLIKLWIQFYLDLFLLKTCVHLFCVCSITFTV